MKLLLTRHGNTFEAGETPYVIGRGEDMPLTAAGEAQAETLARYLRSRHLLPGGITCGPLRRTRRTAELLAVSLGLPAAMTDSRLTELDYGDWAGLTTAQVRERFGDAEVDAWDRLGVVPSSRGWYPGAEQLASHVASFAAGLDPECQGHIALAVTSNGVLRFFARLVDGLFDELASRNALKVATGNLCGLERDENGMWRLLFWNVEPVAG